MSIINMDLDLNRIKHNQDRDIVKQYIQIKKDLDGILSSAKVSPAKRKEVETLIAKIDELMVRDFRLAE